MASPIINELNLAVWTHNGSRELPILTRFLLPMEAQRLMVDATRKATNRGDDPTYPLLKGLSEVLAWFAPGIAYFKIDRLPGEWENGPRFALYMVGSEPGADVKADLRAGLAAWMHIAYDDMP